MASGGVASVLRGVLRGAVSAAGGSCRLSDFLDADEEPDLADHAAGRLVVGDLDAVADPLQAERPDRGPVARDVADRALRLGHAKLTGHWRPPARPGTRPSGPRSGRRSGAPGGAHGPLQRA